MIPHRMDAKMHCRVPRAFQLLAQTPQLVLKLIRLPMDAWQAVYFDSAPASPKVPRVSIGGPSAWQSAGCMLVASAISLISSAFGQTNVDTDLLQTDGSRNLSPVAGV